mgnify:CR=1 FL=1
MSKKRIYIDYAQDIINELKREPNISKSHGGGSPG